MHDAELETTVALAKSAPTDKPKSFWYSEIRKHANRRRLPGQSIESAVAKFIVDRDGAPLLRAMNLAKGAALASPEEPDADDSGGPTEGYKGLQGVAAKLRAADPTMSKQQATAAALRTPEGVRFALQDRKARLG
jgi:hypothetical protein